MELTRCWPTLQPIQSLGVLCYPIAKREKHKKESAYISKSLCVCVVVVRGESFCRNTYFVVSAATGTSQWRVFSISALICGIVSCKKHNVEKLFYTDIELKCKREVSLDPKKRKREKGGKNEKLIWRTNLFLCINRLQTWTKGRFYGRRQSII